MVELLAQAYAAVHGYEDQLSGAAVQEGFLVGVRGLRLEGAARAGDRLLIAIRTVASLEGFAVAEGEVRRGAEVLARGNLKLWLPPRPRVLQGEQAQ